MFLKEKRTSSLLRRVLFASGIVLVTAPGIARADFALKANDRIVFYGDSITDQRQYTNFVETYCLTRFPNLPLTFVHSGWGGDSVKGGGGGPIDLRLKRDVLAYKPTVMTIMLGMNDGAYRAFDQKIFDTYSNGYNHILDTVKQGDPDVRFTLIQPSAYDDVTRAPGFEGGYNGVLQRYSVFVKEAATARNATVADMNTPVVAMLQKANATNAATAQKIIADRVHPGPGGHLILAQALLKAWDAPAVVADVALDATTAQVVRAGNTRISDLQVGTRQTGKALSWTQNDQALPFPLDTNDDTVALVLKSSDFVEALDREPLQVTGLTSAHYTLSIDGEEVGDFSREELGQGINLALLPTPMQAQARAVHKLTQKHNDQHFLRWRNIQVPLESHSAEVQNAELPLLAALDVEESQTVAMQRAAAQPKPHRFELSVAADLSGPNLALHKPYESSDPNLLGFGMGALTDGDWSDDGHTFASGDKDVFPKTVTVDLGAVTPVAHVRVGLPHFGSSKTVKVLVSADGQTFSEVGSYVFPRATTRRHTFTFDAVPTRYVRLLYPDHYEEEAGYSKFFTFTTEVEAYGPTP